MAQIYIDPDVVLDARKEISLIEELSHIKRIYSFIINRFL